MSVGAVFVQRPGGLVGGGGHRHVVNDGHPHAGVGLETEYHDGGTEVPSTKHVKEVQSTPNITGAGSITRNYNSQ